MHFYQILCTININGLKNSTLRSKQKQMQPIQPDPNNNSFNPIPPAPGTNPQPLSPQHNPLVQMTGGSTPGSVPPSTPQPNPSFDNQIPSQPLVPQIGQYDQGSSLPPLDSSPYPTPVPDPQNSLPANPVPDFSQPQTAPPTTGSPDFGQPYQPSPQSNGVPEFSSPGQNNPIASSAQPSTTSSDPTNIDNLPLSSLGSQSDQPQPGLSGLHASSPAEPSTQASTPQPIPTPPAEDTIVF